MKYDILVVEDETSLLRGVVRGLQADPSLTVEGFPTVELALEHLERSVAPDLLITDIRLPGRSGLDLIQELDTRGLRIPVVVTTAHRSAYQDRLPQRAGLTVLEKPVPLADLRKAVRAHLEDARAGAVRSGPFQIVDYLQLASLGRHSVAIEISLDAGERAQIVVLEGLLWSATHGVERGEAALRTLLRATPRGVRCLELDAVLPERQFTATTEHILLSLAKEQDEERHGASLDSDIDASDAESLVPEPPPVRRPASEESPEVPLSDPPASGAPPADDAGLELLRELLLQVPEASRVALLAHGSGVRAALPGASPVRSFPDPILTAALALFSGADSEIAPVEAFVSTPIESLFLRRAERGAVVALVLPATAKAGLGWVAIRDAARTLRETALPDPPPETAADAPLAVALEADLESECRRLATHLEDAGSAEVVDFEEQCLLATSRGADRASQAAASLALRHLVLFLRAATAAGAAAREIEELSLSAPNAQCFAKRLPRSSRLLALSTGARARPGISWIALRESVAALKS